MSTEINGDSASANSVDAQSEHHGSETSEALETSNSVSETEAVAKSEATEATSALSNDTETQLDENEASVAESESSRPKNEALKEEETTSKKRPATESTGSTNEKRSRNIPVHEMVGGSSARRYLNKYLTQHLLEGVKMVERERPEDPLLALGEFLVQRSQDLKEIEKLDMS